MQKSFNLFICTFILLNAMSCSNGWSEKKQEQYLSNCLKTTTLLDVGNENDYCKCMLERSMKRYPTENDFVKAQVSKDQTLIIDLDSCIYLSKSYTKYWPEKLKQMFKEDCFELAKINAIKNPETYCNCILENIMIKHPSAQSKDSISAKEIIEAGANCD